MWLCLVITLFVCTKRVWCHDIKGFDDSVLFNINWPGSNFQDDLDSYEHIIVTSSHEEKYKCFLPNVQEKETNPNEKYEGPEPLELIAPLFSQSSCSYRLDSYWTYEVCHGRFIRQYHEDREGKKVKLQEYILGQWNKDHYKTLLETSTSEIDEKGTQVATKKIDGVSLPYFEITMDNGTLCDLNQNKPRRSKVLYVCFAHGKHEIYSLKETSTCNYEIVVLTPILCSHPKYKPLDTGENQISCVPLDDGPKKPHNLVKMKVDSNKLRKRNDMDTVRLEILPFDLKSAPDESPAASERPMIDTSPVEGFLSGKNCLHGGTGWWKYEFCYGRSVEQYHVEKDKSKTSISLGVFDKHKHVEWLQKHPNKRPKAAEVRSQLSHFYSGGSICDKTGQPRQTEVKLKCLENPTSANAVSLYLLEPRYCEYILGVESPLICDILVHADDNGLVESYNVGGRDRNRNRDDYDDDGNDVTFSAVNA